MAKVLDDEKHNSLLITHDTETNDTIQTISTTIPLQTVSMNVRDMNESKSDTLMINNNNHTDNDNDDFNNDIACVKFNPINVCLCLCLCR